MRKMECFILLVSSEMGDASRSLKRYFGITRPSASVSQFPKNTAVNRLFLILGLFLLSLAVFAEGKLSVSFASWPPELLFPSTSILWRVVVAGMGSWLLWLGWRGLLRPRE